MEAAARLLKVGWSNRPPFSQYSSHILRGCWGLTPPPPRISFAQGERLVGELEQAEEWDV